jgi:hypothetical protein
MGRVLQGMVVIILLAGLTGCGGNSANKALAKESYEIMVESLLIQELALYMNPEKRQAELQPRAIKLAERVAKLQETENSLSESDQKSIEKELIRLAKKDGRASLIALLEQQGIKVK